MLKNNNYVLIDGGTCPSNLVYIDNVIDAILLALTKDAAIGHPFIISDDQLITWKEVFATYAQMFPNPPVLLNLPSEKITTARAQQRSKILKAMISNPYIIF